MASSFATIKLRRPVQFGRDAEPVTELELKATGRALRDLVVPMGAEGDLRMMMVKPYDLCLVGLRMAGVAGDKAFVDQMDPRDIWEVGQAVLGFTMDAPTSGSTPSE
jgi:hypothetical protein